MRKKRSGPFIAEHLAEQRKMRRMGKLSDEEFLAVLKKHGLDPLTGKRSDKLVSPTGLGNSLPSAGVARS